MIRGTVMMDILQNLYFNHTQMIGGTLISVNVDPDECQCFGDFDIDVWVAWASTLAREPPRHIDTGKRTCPCHPGRQRRGPERRRSPRASRRRIRPEGA